jgi:hypothetical protein
MQGIIVKRADILSLLAAVIILLFIAFAAPEIRTFLDITDDQESAAFTPPIFPAAGQASPKTFTIWQIHLNDDLSSIYASGTQGYPVLDFPQDMNIYGASDTQSPPIWSPGEERQFAEFSGKRSGFSEIFRIPYSIWRVHADIKARNQPQNSRIDWIIVDAGSGDIVTGNSIAYGGSVTKNIQGSGSFYFLVSNQNADSYQFFLETTRAAFGDTLIEPDVVHLKDYLNAI